MPTFFSLSPPKDDGLTCIRNTWEWQISIHAHKVNPTAAPSDGQLNTDISSRKKVEGRRWKRKQKRISEEACRSLRIELWRNPMGSWWLMKKKTKKSKWGECCSLRIELWRNLMGSWYRSKFFLGFQFWIGDPINEDREHDVDVLESHSSQVTHRRHCIWLSSNPHDHRH